MADTDALAERFRHFVRVTDVVDGLDAVGRADMTLMDPKIRPLWFGMTFWGPAVTMRVLPANQRMRPVTREEAQQQHGIWFREQEQRLGNPRPSMKEQINTWVQSERGGSS